MNNLLLSWTETEEEPLFGYAMDSGFCLCNVGMNWPEFGIDLYRMDYE